MNKAIFLDRDGIINEEIGDYVKRFEDFKLLPHLAETLKNYQSQGFLIIVITNQGGLAKGLYNLTELNKMHQYFLTEMEKAGVSIAEIYFCPHHPDFNGNCLCRKPGSLLVEKAMARFNIDPKASYFIGDRPRDAEAGEKVGVKGILVPSNTLLKDILLS
jgi:D-glycero-D-manno-heptose 1,7-bisphosphate phosphatase